jgi:putative protease
VQNIELLSPAGSLEKLYAAIRFGADAVYFSGGSFGMRAAAANFSDPELIEAVKYAHRMGKRAYVTVNTMPREDEYPALEAYMEVLRAAAPDAVIVADIGVLSLFRKRLPEIELHLSTQANAVSSAACRAWYELGARRIVLARELTLREIREIRKNLPSEIELEVFIHGSMCVSYSGRCLLSSFFTGRDANRGACTQPCRWGFSIGDERFALTEEKRPDTSLPIVEEGGETFFLSSKDLCMISHVPDLLECGATSFKIEGRMKSAYYTAVVTNAYRMAIDRALSGDRVLDPAWLRELESVSHREYATGFFYDDPRECANVSKSRGYIGEKSYLATVLAYDEKTGIACLEQRNKLSVGDAVELLTPGKIGQALTVKGLCDAEHQPIESAPHPRMRFYMQMPFPVREGDILRSPVN